MVHFEVLEGHLELEDVVLGGRTLRNERKETGDATTMSRGGLLEVRPRRTNWGTRPSGEGTWSPEWGRVSGPSSTDEDDGGSTRRSRNDGENDEGGFTSVLGEEVKRSLRYRPTVNFFLEFLLTPSLMESIFIKNL